MFDNNYAEKTEIKKEVSKVDEISTKITEALIDNCSPQEIAQIFDIAHKRVTDYWRNRVACATKELEELKQIAHPLVN